MNKRLLNHCILIGLALMFLAPGLAAYFIYQHSSALSFSKVNQGMLLNPPVLLKTVGKQNKWKLILWHLNGCDKACLQQLDRLTRLRMALGRRFYEVDQWLLLDYKAPPLTAATRSLLKQNHVYVNNLSPSESNRLTNLAPNLKIFIASPDNYLILGYAPRAISKTTPSPHEMGEKKNETSELEKVYVDLKRLLNTTTTRVT